MSARYLLFTALLTSPHVASAATPEVVSPALSASIEAEINALDHTIDRLRLMGHDEVAASPRGTLGRSAATAQLRLARTLAARRDWYGAEAAVSDAWNDLVPSIRNVEVFGTTDQLQGLIDGMDLVIARRTEVLAPLVRDTGDWDHELFDQGLDEHWTSLDRDANARIAHALSWETLALSTLDSVTLDLLPEA
ncbi:MAG: hypothetical protein H6738_10800 [Alphaproteobacteria bacterium]|nr:hypothetical protein [Alphaproteobacteria bacterium]MCB9697259.1 hypothetical protein [Alphaproteobacteria bacterium]